MAQFFKFLFASCLGTALALLLLGFFGISILTTMANSVTAAKKVAVKPNTVLELDFKSLIPEKTNNTQMDPFVLEQENIVGLTDLVKTIGQAKEDPDIKGIYLNASYIMAGKATSSVLRAALADFKTSGKFIVSYANYYN